MGRPPETHARSRARGAAGHRAGRGAQPSYGRCRVADGCRAATGPPLEDPRHPLSPRGSRPRRRADRRSRRSSPGRAAENDLPRGRSSTSRPRFPPRSCEVLSQQALFLRLTLRTRTRAPTLAPLCVGHRGAGAARPALSRAGEGRADAVTVRERAPLPEPPPPACPWPERAPRLGLVVGCLPLAPVSAWSWKPTAGRLMATAWPSREDRRPRRDLQPAAMPCCAPPAPRTRDRRGTVRVAGDRAVGSTSLPPGRRSASPRRACRHEGDGSNPCPGCPSATSKNGVRDPAAVVAGALDGHLLVVEHVVVGLLAASSCQDSRAPTAYKESWTSSRSCAGDFGRPVL